MISKTHKKEQKFCFSALLIGSGRGNCTPRGLKALGYEPSRILLPTSRNSKKIKERCFQPFLPFTGFYFKLRCLITHIVSAYLLIMLIYHNQHVTPSLAAFITTNFNQLSRLTIFLVLVLFDIL